MGLMRYESGNENLLVTNPFPDDWYAMPSGSRAKRGTSPFFVTHLPRLAHFIRAALVQALDKRGTDAGCGCLNAS
jgi:hypothetical protein